MRLEYMCAFGIDRIKHDLITAQTHTLVFIERRFKRTH